MRTFYAATLLSLCAIGSTPAFAQKSDDTIRLAINAPFSTVDTYVMATEEQNMFIRNIYQHLINYDENKKKWVPTLATAYRRIDDTTLEFDLRDDVKYHNGNPFNADDVKYILEYLADPASKVLVKDQYTWVKNVEVLSPYKIRIHETKPISTDLGILAYRIRIYDAETHKALEDKSDYGRKPVGTGPYKITSFDRNRGLTAEKTTNYFEKDGYFRATAKRIQGLFIPDQQTRVAQLMTGGIDLMRNIGPDEAVSLAANPKLGVTTTASGTLLYITLDAAGRSDNKAMMDERVRKALIMAIDRDKLVKAIVPGGNQAYLTPGICLPAMFGCGPTFAPYPYDPAQAKRLLAEAGYPNGFDLVIDANEPVKYFAEAVAGEVRKIGIRASVQSLSASVYVKKRGDGDFTTFVGSYPTGTHPDMASMLDFFFGGNRDYWNDASIKKAQADGDVEFDDVKRSALYTPVLDRVNEEAYIFPISEMPMLWAHDKDVKITANPLLATSPVLGDFSWK